MVKGLGLIENEFCSKSQLAASLSEGDGGLYGSALDGVRA